MAQALIFLTGFVSFFPQYWLPNMTSPSPSAKEKTQQAEVIAVGSGKIVDGKEVPVQVKPGDRVIYGKYTGTEIKYEGEKYLVINADDIIAIVKD